MKRVILIVCFGTPFLFGRPLAPPPADHTVLIGYTYTLDQNGKYHPFPGVHVWAVRNDPVREEGRLVAVDAGDDGFFELKVPGSEPFSVFFNGTDKVPELYQFAGTGIRPSPPNVVKVALLTDTQHIELVGNNGHLGYKKAAIDYLIEYHRHRLSKEEREKLGITDAEVKRWREMKERMHVD